MNLLQLQEESAHRELITPLEQRRRKYLKRRAEHGDRNDEVSTVLVVYFSIEVVFLNLFVLFPACRCCVQTMDKLKRFTEVVRSTKQQQSKQADSSATAGTEEPAHYHGQVGCTILYSFYLTVQYSDDFDIPLYVFIGRYWRRTRGTSTRSRRSASCRRGSWAS